jgi:hypothetical protein
MYTSRYPLVNLFVCINDIEEMIERCTGGARATAAINGVLEELLSLKEAASRPKQVKISDAGLCHEELEDRMNHVAVMIDDAVDELKNVSQTRQAEIAEKASLSLVTLADVFQQVARCGTEFVSLIVQNAMKQS